jgi:WW domain-binding protein 4
LQLQQSQGVVGQWEVIESTPSAPLPALLPQKRPLDDDDEETHGFKVQRRKLAEGLGEVYDPGKIIIAPKKELADETKLEEKGGEIVAQEQPKALKWSTKRWKVGGGEEDEEAEPAEEINATVAKKEQPKEGVAHGEPITSPLLEAKTEPPPDEGPAEIAVLLPKAYSRNEKRLHNQ